MTKRLPATPAPGPLEDYVVRFDDLFATLAQRQAFRRYLEGLLLPAERNKTLTALANTEPVGGAQRKEAQGLQWFLSESSWDPQRINRRRIELMLEDPKTAPSRGGALVIDETGDRKDGKKTAHVGKQYLGGIGKIDNGVVSVSSLWADERIYYPLEVEPYTPAHHFDEGKAAPEFRTKPKIALELVERALEMEIPFRAVVVADILYGEHRKFKEGLENRQIPYVLAIKPSYAWYHPIGEPGSVEEIAWIAPWKGEHDPPGEWVKLERTFRDGHTEQWWALEAECRPFGVEKQRRLVVATTDPAELPDLSTWYLVSNLPAPGTKRAQEESKLSATDIAEVVRLYSLRFTQLDRAKLQEAGKELAGLVPIPGQEGPSHKAPLAAGVLRVHVLLVGKRWFSGGRGATWGDPQERRECHNLHSSYGGGEGEKGRARGRADYFSCAGRRR